MQFYFDNQERLPTLRLSDATVKLVCDAIGKYIHPTQYQQIIETESCETLDTTEQEWISEDQKQSSHVAKIHYRNKRSRDVALKGQQCLKKLKGQEGEMVEKRLMSLVSEDEEDASDPEDIFITQNKIKDVEQSDVLQLSQYLWKRKLTMRSLPMILRLMRSLHQENKSRGFSSLLKKILLYDKEYANMVLEIGRKCSMTKSCNFRRGELKMP